VPLPKDRNVMHKNREDVRVTHLFPDLRLVEFAFVGNSKELIAFTLYYIYYANQAYIISSLHISEKNMIIFVIFYYVAFQNYR